MSHLDNIFSFFLYQILLIKTSCCLFSGFPGGSGHKESTCRRLCRRRQKCRFDLWVGKLLGGRNDNPLQYSCLENCIARGGWQPSIYGVTKSLTRLPTPIHKSLLILISFFAICLYIMLCHESYYWSQCLWDSLKSVSMCFSFSRFFFFSITQYLPSFLVRESSLFQF